MQQDWLSVREYNVVICIALNFIAVTTQKYYYL